MSSYKGTYNSWRGGADRGVGSFSSASSTSGIGSSTASKYNGSLGLKSVESSPTRESSYTSGIADRSSSLDTRGTTPTSRFSALSARLKETERPSPSTTTSSYGTGKSSLNASTFSKDKPALSSYGIGGSSVNSITSRFGSTLGSSPSSTSSANTATDSSNTGGSPFRPSGTSGYIRSTRDSDLQRFSKGSNSFLDETGSKNSNNPNSTSGTKRLSGSTLSLGSSTSGTPINKDHWQVKEDQRQGKEGTPISNKVTGSSTGPADRERGRERDRERIDRDPDRTERERDRDRIERERDRDRIERERDRDRIERERDRDRTERERDRDRTDRERDRDRTDRERDRDRIDRDRDRIDRDRDRTGTTGTSSQSASSTSTGLTTGNASGLSSYKPYTPRTLLSADLKPLTAPTSSSSLRASARYGLKSGSSITHYSTSLPTASTIKAAAILTEEAKKQLSKNQYHKEKQEQYREIEEVTSWHSRGTCTILDAADDDSDMAADDISLDEETSFAPRTFNPRYEGVLKHKAVQTEEEPKSKYAGLSSIPRPPIAMNFSSPFTAVMNRFNAEKAAKASASESTSASGPSSSPGLELINRRGSLKKVSNSSDSAVSGSSNNSKDVKTGNNSKSVSYTGATTTTSNPSSTDHSSRSSLPSRQTSPTSRSNSLSNKSRTTDGEDVVTNCKNNSGSTNTEQATMTASSATKKLPTKASSPPATTTLNAGGLVVNLANKEYVRKSVLNVGETKDDEQRKQEGETSRVTATQKAAMASSNDTKDEDNERNGSNNTRSSLLSGGNKRDSTRRPPTDPNKSSNSTTNQQVNRSISRMSSQYNLNNASNSSANSSRASSPSPAGTATGNSGTNNAAGAPTTVLQRMKSSKNVNPLRKLSLENSNASDSDSSVTSSSRGIGASFAKLKKKLSIGGDNSAASGTESNNNSISTNNNISNNAANLEKKGQLRRGSATSGGATTASSSTASSRSGSVERGSQNASTGSPLHPSSMKKSLSKSETRSSLRTSPSSSSDSERKKKGSVSIQTPEEEAKALANNSEQGYNGVQDDSEEPKQTPFFLRMMSDTPWVRKCQSGEIPWWMASSNSDVPGALGRNPSRSVIKVPTTKDIQEEIAAANPIIASKPNMDDDSSSSELSDIECDDDGLDLKMTRPLGERTSPDGREIPAITMPDGLKGETPFIGNLRNIDDILGFLPSNLLAPSPSPAPPTPTPASTALQEAMDELVEAQRKLQLVGQANTNDDDDSDSESSSSELSEADPLDKPKDDEDESDSSSDEEDERSTGTSSSFEEVDPTSLTIPVPARARSHSLASTSQKSDGKSKQIDIENMEAVLDTSGLIPESQREQLDDATLQIYRDGDYGTYLDLEASISEQQEEFEGFHNNRKNSIVLRAQLPVRVHAIIEKLINSDGRELRRALFSLKQIFQEDKDLVHEFVENGGLSCLIKVGSDADQNYQNYILRAIGQVMLYVDGMYGVMRHNETIQWLYSLTASKFRLVQKTALKLLLVFVEYVETNCLLLVQAVGAVDNNRGAALWSNVMNLLRDHDSNSGDSELLIYAMTLVNKVLNGIPELDTYYDQIDALEEQGMATIIQNYMGKQCADLDLIQQFQIYEMVLKHEDGEEDNIMMQLDESMRQKLLTRKGYCEVEGNNKNRRKSRRRSTNTPPTTPNGSSNPIFPHPVIRRLSSTEDPGKDSMDDGSSTTSSHSSSPGPPNGTPPPPPYIIAGYANEKCNANGEITPALRRRRERVPDHHKSLVDQKTLNGSASELSESLQKDNSSSLIPLGRSVSGRKDSLGNISNSPSSGMLEQQNNLKNSSSNGSFTNGNCGSPNGSITVARPWMLPIYTKTNGTATSSTSIANGEPESPESSEAKREHTVKDLTQKLANQSLLTSPVDENKSLLRSGELSGVVSKAKEGLAKSKSRVDLKPPQGDSGTKGMQVEVKKSDNDFHWDFLVMNLHRSLEICDLDFTDLKTSDDEDIMAPNPAVMNNCHIPPPLPPMFSSGNVPPPPPGRFGAAPPPPSVNGFGSSAYGTSLNNRQSPTDLDQGDTLRKTKKTVKLFWKEVREDPITASKVEKVGSLWTELQSVTLDTQRLEHLFESRAKDVINKKQSDANKTKEITVLDPKRSNAINIGMTKLPPPRTIKAAIMKMDSTIINREGIEKLLSMLPTEEERAKITEAQFANPETPLGSAEQFLLTLASISELTARLKLWAFKLDYENLEKEVAEPLMDLKQGIESLEKNKTFRQILTTLLCIGNFLNGADAKGFQIDYLSKVPEVKDTVHKHSLLHHLCHMVLENYPESSDLYSEIGPVTRASRVDFDEVATNLTKMETDCKASWDHLKVIAKHDGPTNMKLKMSEFLADCAERIIVLGIIHRRVMNRFHKFLLWLGVPAHQVPTSKPHLLFKTISEFALEYRTTRERVMQQLQKKANHRERNKTRGKMITEQIMYKTKEDKADEELREVLTKSRVTNGDGEIMTGSLTWSRRPKNHPSSNGPINPGLHLNNKSATLGPGSPLVDGDDEILESLVKTATRTSDSRMAPRERKRNSARYSDRKSLRRTLRHGLSEEERKMLSAFMANGHSFC